MSPLDKAIEQLREAIDNEGNHPKYHQEVLKRHREEWPMLWNAIDQIIRLDKIKARKEILKELADPELEAINEKQRLNNSIAEYTKRLKELDRQLDHAKQFNASQKSY